MKKFRKILLAVIMAVVVPFAMLFSGCDAINLNSVTIVSIEKTSTDGLVDTYTITYSDGKTSTFTVTNGADGQNGTDGVDGADGQDGTDGVDGEQGEQGEQGPVGPAGPQGPQGEQGEKGETGEKGADGQDGTNGTDGVDSELARVNSIAKCLQSAVTIYTFFSYNTTDTNNNPIVQTGLFVGSGVVWSIESDYTYIATNAHVMYNADANLATNNNCYNPLATWVYLYGSEDRPTAVNNGGSYGVSATLVGVMIDYDVAVIKVNTSELQDKNADVAEIECASDYYVGQSAFTIGNPSGYGISVTTGTISRETENIALNFSGSVKTYRVLRMDTSIYGGSSGGGLFNSEGKLIGLSNAGDNEKQNMNYAVPLNIVKSCVENALYYENDGDPTTSGALGLSLGLTVTPANSKYVYDENTKLGRIYDLPLINSVSAGSLASNLGLVSGDVVTSISINDVEFTFNCSYNFMEKLLDIRAGDRLIITYNDASSSYASATTNEVTINSSNLIAL